jgi:arginyl-tRNA synthetase
MNILAELRSRFTSALTPIAQRTGLSAAEIAELAAMVRPSQDPKFGDYQANFAMPLGKRLGRPPRDVAAETLVALQLDDLCQPPEIAGPGFINLRI